MTATETALGAFLVAEGSGVERTVHVVRPTASGDPTVDPRGEAGPVFVLRRDNPLSADWSPPAVLLGARALVTYSGTLADSLWDAHPRNWMPAGRAALDAWWRDASSWATDRELTICLQPAARHVLSDVPSTLSFLRSHEGDRVGLVLSPADLLEVSMLPRLEEHLERIFAGLGPLADAVALRDIRGGDGDRLEGAPLGDGDLPREATLTLLERHVPPSVPVLLEHDRRLARQLAWLAGAEVSADAASG